MNEENAMQRKKVSARAITIEDVAREAGVSYATVSRVINNTATVRRDKYERVVETMTRLGYVVNQHARSLAGGRSHILGLLVTDISNPFIGELARGVNAELEDTAYDLFIYATHKNKEKEANYVSKLINYGADGLLLIIPFNADAYIATLQQRHIPYVIYDYEGSYQDIPSVGTTNWQGGYDATRYLIGLEHRRIGVITGPTDIASARQRLDGYKAACLAAGLPIDEHLIVEGDYSQEGGRAGCETLMALADPPTAIFACNDNMAFGVMQKMRAYQLRIPDDLSLIGFDDHPHALLVDPALTTIRQPIGKIGRLAARMLIEYIHDPEQPIKRVSLKTELVERASCSAPRTHHLHFNGHQ